MLRCSPVASPRTPLRRDRGSRAVARRVRGFSFTDERRGARGRRRRRLLGWLGVVPLLRRHLGVRGGRAGRPALSAARRRGHLRRGRPARDGAAVGLQPRLRRRRRRVADGAAAGARPCLEMGSSRTHEQAAVAAARAAYVAGFAATSNLAARATFGVPTLGTSAHAFTLAARRRGRRLQRAGAALGVGTTLLVDTYDVAEAVRIAVEVAGHRARRRPSRLRRPRPRRARGPRASSTPSAPLHAHRGDQRPRRARDRRPHRLLPGRQVRRRHPARHRLGARHGGFVYKLVAREGADGELMSVAKDRRTRRQSAAASTPCAAAPPTDRPGRGGRDRRAAPDDGDDRPLLVPAGRGGEVVGRRRSTRPAPATAPRSPSSPRGRDDDVPGEPVIPTVLEG